MEGARDAHSECRIFRPREEIICVASKDGPRAKSSVWQCPAQRGDSLVSETCLKGQAASRAVEVLVTGSGHGGGLCTGGSVVRASSSV